VSGGTHPGKNRGRDARDRDHFAFPTSSLSVTSTV
jgi:hypothetical protein